jgi:hypothetical protein
MDVLTELFDLLFFASIKTEEARPVSVRVFYVDPQDPDPAAPPRIRIDRWRIFRLSQPVPLTVANLVKLAKAADPWASGLAVFHHNGGGLFVWGKVDQVVHISMALVQENSGSYPPPGIFHAMINGAADISVFKQNSFIARLSQDTTIDTQNDCLWEGPISERLVSWIEPLWRGAFKLVRREALTGWRDFWRVEAKELWTQTLSRILINIQRQRHGGAILFCPATEDSELSIKYALDYRRIPEAMLQGLRNRISGSHAREMIDFFMDEKDANEMLTGLLLDDAVSDGDVEDAQESLTGAVRFISSMAGVDGLILASPDFSICGFGVEIIAQQDLEELTATSSADLKVSRKVRANSYGTRHRSMARFCAKNPKSIGFVVSQDGDIRALMQVGNETVLFENVQVHSLWDDDFPKRMAAQRALKRRPRNRSSIRN